MKKIFSNLFLLCLGLMALAQPQKINYQAIALGSNGKPLKNTAVSLRLSILDSAANGTVLYTETQPATTDAGGQFSVYLGTGTPTAGTFASLPWANGNDKFLKVEMDAQVGTNYQTMGTTQLVSVPYAMAAGNAKVADELKLGTIVRGNAGRTWQLTESINGPAWTCYPPVAAANAGADQLNVCGNTVTISGNTDSGMTPAWSIINGTDGSLNGNTFTGIRGNAYSLRYTLTNACGTTSDTLQISLALPATVVANAGPDQLSILTGTTAFLAANNPGDGQTGTWTIITGSGATLSDVSDPTATFNVGTDSAYTLDWTISSPCGTSRDTLNISFKNLNVPCPGVARVNYAGESYPTVQIGTQCWLAKNLNVGTMIQGANDQTNNSTLEKFCYNNDTANCAIYGGLYQWGEAVQYQNGASDTTSPNPAFTGNVRGICPMGWHLPSDAEYCTLTTFLDAMVDCYTIGWSGTDVAQKMSLWSSPNSGAMNISGFSAMPGGVRDNFGGFGGINALTCLRSTSEVSSDNSIARELGLFNSDIYRGYYDKIYGLSVRCIKD